MLFLKNSSRLFCDWFWFFFRKTPCHICTQGFNWKNRLPEIFLCKKNLFFFMGSSNFCSFHSFLSLLRFSLFSKRNLTNRRFEVQSKKQSMAILLVKRGYTLMVSHKTLPSFTLSSNKNAQKVHPKQEQVDEHIKLWPIFKMKKSTSFTGISN